MQRSEAQFDSTVRLSLSLSLSILMHPLTTMASPAAMAALRIRPCPLSQSLHPLLPHSLHHSRFLTLPVLRRTDVPAFPRLFFFARGGEGFAKVTAKKSSSELRNASSVAESDEKLRALRELFSRPGVGIDAYVIPSQDAHQVAEQELHFC